MKKNLNVFFHSKLWKLARIGLGLLLAVGTCTKLGGSFQVSAQTKPALDLMVFPPTAYLHVKPGKSLSHRVLLQYTGSQALQATVEIKDFTSDGKTGVPVLQDTTSFSTLTLVNPPYAKLGEPFIIHPNTRLDLVIALEPAPTMIEKEYPLALIVKTEPLPGGIGQNSGAATSGTIASNMILWVSTDGDGKGELVMNQFPMPRLVDSFGKISVAALAENTGESAIAPKGTITLYHWRGKQLNQWHMFPDVVLAHSSRLVRGTLEDPSQLKAGDNPKLVEMSHDAPFLLGPYTVVTQLEKPDGTTEQHTITVLALPFSIALAILGGVGLYGAYLWLAHLQTKKRW